jgi:hypothetical protein
LQLRTSEVLDHILPIRGVVISSQVGLQLSTQDLQGRTLPNTIGANQTYDLTWSGCGQAMKLEAVGRVSMCDVRLEIGWQIDDIDSSKGTLLWADTTTDAKTL